eukprot:6398374-Amphidinium_carterae.1
MGAQQLHISEYRKNQYLIQETKDLRKVPHQIGKFGQWITQLTLEYSKGDRMNSLGNSHSHPCCSNSSGERMMLITPRVHRSCNITYDMHTQGIVGVLATNIIAVMSVAIIVAIVIIVILLLSIISTIMIPWFGGLMRNERKDI